MSCPVHKNLFHWIKVKICLDQYPWLLIVILIKFERVHNNGHYYLYYVLILIKLIDLIVIMLQIYENSTVE